MLSRREFLKRVGAALIVTAAGKRAVDNAKFFDFLDEKVPQIEISGDQEYKIGVSAFAKYEGRITPEITSQIAYAMAQWEFEPVWFKPTPDCPWPVGAWECRDGKLVQVWPPQDEQTTA